MSWTEYFKIYPGIFKGTALLGIVWLLKLILASFSVFWFWRDRFSFFKFYRHGWMQHWYDWSEQRSSTLHLNRWVWGRWSEAVLGNPGISPFGSYRASILHTLKVFWNLLWKDCYAKLLVSWSNNWIEDSGGRITWCSRI